MNKFIAERQVQYPMFNQYEPNVKAPIAFLKLLNVKVNNVLQKQQNLMQELYPEIFFEKVAFVKAMDAFNDWTTQWAVCGK